MTVGELIKSVLIKADEVGEEEEYRASIIDAINSVTRKIINFAKNNKKYVTLETDNKEITMPSDFFSLVNVKNINNEPVLYTRTGKKTIKLEQDGEYNIIYNSYLDKLEDNVEDDYELEIEECAEECLIYGCACQITMDNEELYPILVSEYNNLLSNLSLLDELPEYNRILRVDGWWY